MFTDYTMEPTCRRRDSNPHASCEAADFESALSTSSMHDGKAEGEGIEPPSPYGPAVFETVSSSIRTPSKRSEQDSNLRSQFPSSTV